MRALVDRVTCTSRPAKGTVVHLEDELEWKEGSVVQHWTEDRPATEHGPWSTEDAMDAAPEQGR